MKGKTVIAALLPLLASAGYAQSCLPAFRYSREPAVLIGQVVGDSTLKAYDMSVSYTMKYSSGMGDARRGMESAADENGRCLFSLPSGTTVDCLVTVGDHGFSCYIVPGDTVSFTLDAGKLNAHGMADALTFDGQLADFNHDLVYAAEKGFDPKTIYRDLEMKRNGGTLSGELKECSIDGYFSYLDSIRRRVDERIDTDRTIGNAYREFAKAANHYMYGEAIPSCAYSIRYAGLDTEEKYAVYARRVEQMLESYMQGDPWSDPALSYVMWGTPESALPSGFQKSVRLPDDYRQCHLASRYLMMIGRQSQLLSEAQKDSIGILLPELGRDVLDYNEKLERKLSFINEHGKSRICSIPDDKADSDDILSAVLERYHGRPVLLDLWETTCGPCRLAFKQMHDKKLELSDRIHFVNIASERSDRAEWERLVPNYVGDHYLLTERQLKALHGQIPCDAAAVPVWVLVNADGSIHHAFIGWSNVEQMMMQLAPVLQ